MTYSIPYSFIPGTKARAQEVNANFNYVLDSMGDLNSTKLNASLSNITNAGIDIIKNCTAFRNIGEIISTVSPLNDAGLHLLDGTLLSGSGSYSDFVDHIADLYEEIIANNASAFTVVGELTIGDDENISNFKYNSYLYANVNLDITKPITFYGSFTVGETTGAGRTFFGIQADKAVSFTLMDNNKLNIATSGVTSTSTFVQGQTYDYKIVLDNGVYYIYIKENGEWVLEIQDDGTQGAYTNITINQNITKIVLGANTTLLTENNNRRWTGSISLKKNSITVNGEKVFSGFNPSNIFTTEADWQTSVANNGGCAWFVYNSANNTVRLPKMTGFTDGTTNLPIVLYYIVVATSTQTDIQVDIDNIATDLNGKADKDLSNINPTQAIKNSIMSWGIPDYNNGITYVYTTANTEQEYTMPSKGYFAYTLVGGNTTAAYAYIKINNKEIVYGKHPVGNAHAPITGLIPVESGDNVKVRSEYTTANTALITHIEFIPLKGVN